MISSEVSSDTKLRILYLTQWFEPEPAFKGVRFVRALMDAGHDVKVLTGFPNYPGGKLYPGYKVRFFQREEIEGVSINRVPLWPSHDKSLLGRITNYLSFFVSAFIYCLSQLSRFDVVYVYHPPLTAGLAAALAGVFRRTPFVLDVQDLWPDSVAASGMGNGVIVTLLSAMCNFVYKRAACVVCQSDGMLELIADRGVPRDKLVRIYNWSNYSKAKPDDTTVMPEFVSEAFEGVFNIVYGGNVGQAQGLEYLAEAVTKAHKSDPRLRFHIFGSGIEKDKIAELARHSNGVVWLHESLPRDTVDRIFERADVLALHLKSEELFKHTIPSKLQHYLSVGRPILAGIEGEGARILERSGAARIVAPEDVTALAAALVDLARQEELTNQAMSHSALNYYSRHLSFDRALKTTLAIIEKASRRQHFTVGQSV